MKNTAWVVFFIGVLVLLKTSFLGIHLVPSVSMEPQVLPGDRIVTNKLAYGFWPPFFNTPLVQWAVPTRGDVVLCSFADRPEVFIKRVVGLPGDLISFENGQLFINGVGAGLDEQGIHPSDPNTKAYQEWRQPLFPYPHTVYLEKEAGATFFESRRFLTPPGAVFVLGDNRDESMDSRTYGFVDLKQVYGRASLVLFSTTGDDTLLPHFRKSRTVSRLSGTMPLR